MKSIKCRIVTTYYVNGVFDDAHTTEAMEEKECLKIIKRWGKEDKVVAKGEGFVAKQITSNILCTSRILYTIEEE